MGISKLLRKLVVRISEKREFYVQSDEPFASELILRGPFTRKDASKLMSINSACGSDDVLMIKKEGQLVLA